MCFHSFIIIIFVFEKIGRKMKDDSVIVKQHYAGSANRGITVYTLPKSYPPNTGGIHATLFFMLPHTNAIHIYIYSKSKWFNCQQGRYYP